MALSPTVSGALLGILGFAFYSVYDVGAKVLGWSYHPFQIIAMTSLFVLPMMMLYAMLDREPGSLRPNRPGLMALRCVMTVINFTGGVSTFTLLPMSEAYVILFSTPLMIALIAVPVLGEKLDGVRIVAVLLGLGGVIYALDPTTTSPGLGHACALVGSLAGAVNFVLVRKTGSVERMSVMLLWPQLTLLAVISATMPLYYQPMQLGDLGIGLGMALAYILGTMALLAAYRKAAAVVVAPMHYSQIVWGALGGALLFNEPQSSRIFLGAALVALAGVLVVTRQNRSAAKA
ncbi:DMT family transporter [Xinfangfangia sp. CPCC 101601]|uniref:DMT family transporter n=1 Tax=Pseudogemmobacter lacusdianii TaxID=3069608 RepID=A0ABU0VYM7_9RHOB|nr:DMT family transporter [Xinfangfangia sp. CPCC 101601]MDQ2066843.1 DMT family transporter [Xinfangfangia sp. CPCC 101601]